jgi:TolB-like protein/DNA-binding winged helix-turn-helix (wHTH) protein/tetratricopeptide (TPR) repeat protein
LGWRKGLNKPPPKAAVLESGFKLGPWHVEPNRNAVILDGEETHLENRLMQTLVFLAENQGQVVSRDEFFDSVWQGRVVNEEALSRAISLLRTVLGDDAQAPTYIQTIPGVGYRLIAEVVSARVPQGSGSSATGDTVDSATARPFTKKLGRLIRAGLVLVLLLEFGYFSWGRFGPDPDSEQGPSAVVEGPQAENSVVVLPFVNMSSDPEQEFFADGMTEEILNLLAGVSNLRVTARTSSFFFKGLNLPLSSIAETLNVRHVLEGSVRKSGDQVRITAQLIEAGSDTHVWSETYDVALVDVLETQDAVATAIASALVDSFEGLELDSVSHTDSLAAFEAYRTGRLLWWRRSPEDLMAAIDLFNKAIESDPGFAPAYAAVADSWMLLVLYGKTQVIDGVDNASPMIEKAFALDPESPDAFAALGLTRAIVGYKTEAEEHLRKAIALDEDYIPAYAWLAGILSELGRLSEQGAVLQEALAKDPLNRVLTTSYATNLSTRGDVAGAKQLVEGLLRMQPDHPMLLLSLAELESNSGNLVEAWTAAKSAYDLAPDNTLIIIAMAELWMDLGAMAEAEEVFQAGLVTSPRNVDIKRQYLQLLMKEGRVEDAQRLKDGLFPKDISWLPDPIKRVYHQETGKLFLAKGDFQQARDHLEKALNPDETQLYDDNQLSILTLTSLLNKGLGDANQAEKRLQMAERVAGHARVNGTEDAGIYYSVACIFALRGENERALQALQQAYDKGWRKLWFLENDGRLDAIRDEAGFQRLMDQLTSDVIAANEKIRG